MFTRAATKYERYSYQTKNCKLKSGGSDTEEHRCPLLFTAFLWIFSVCERIKLKKLKKLNCPKLYFILVPFWTKKQHNPVNTLVIKEMEITHTNIKNPSDFKIPDQNNILNLIFQAWLERFKLKKPISLKLSTNRNVFRFAKAQL